MEIALPTNPQFVANRVQEKEQGSRLPALGSGLLSVSFQHLGEPAWRKVEVPLDRKAEGPSRRLHLV